MFCGFYVFTNPFVIVSCVEYNIYSKIQLRRRLSMFCEQCGKDIPENSKFCAGCGAKTEPAEPIVQAVESEAQQAPTPEPIEPPKAQPAPPPPPQPAPVVNTNKNTQYNNRDNLIKPLSIGAYIGTFIILAIPIVNLIMLLVWSFSDSVNINKKHLAIAILILILISIVLSIGLAILMASLGFGMMGWYNSF